MMDNGNLCVTGKELAAFTQHVNTQPVAPHLWLINTTTGVTKVERRADFENIPAGWALIMDGPDPAWVAQWNGDLQRACDEQLNPLIAEAFKREEM
jgi:hypothetical protein